MGGSNQNLFLIGALMISQGTAAIPLLIAGLALGWMAIFIPSAESSVLLGARPPLSARLVTTPS